MSKPWTAFVCPICQDGPNLGPVSGREWSCSNGHAHVDAIKIEVVPADQLSVRTLERIRDHADSAEAAAMLAQAELDRIKGAG